MMAASPQERLSILREKIRQQRNTVEALKRGNHVHTDAERQLRQMLADLQVSENFTRPT
jgi:hypothetical protein